MRHESAAARHLGRVEQTVAAPAGAEEPRVRRCDGRGRKRRGRMESSIPSGEEAAGGRWIDARRAGQRASGLREVASRIEQDVRQRVSHFAWSP